VVQLLEVEERQFRTNLVMSYSEYDLSQLIGSLEYPIDRTIVKRVFYQLLEAVAYIHRQGVIHRDIKPSNILLSGELTLRLCDFGSAV
jgi:serine/threonine protein kinase